MEKGFACSNVALGVGSFSMHCIEENGSILNHLLGIIPVLVSKLVMPK